MVKRARENKRIIVKLRKTTLKYKKSGNINSILEKARFRIYFNSFQNYYFR